MTDTPNPPTNEGDLDDNPALSNVLERNIRTTHERGLQDRVADAITSFAGRMTFVYVHVLWFGAWIALNTGRFEIERVQRKASQS